MIKFYIKFCNNPNYFSYFLWHNLELSFKSATYILSVRNVQNQTNPNRKSANRKKKKKSKSKLNREFSY